MNITRFLALRNLFLFLTGALIISFTGCTTLALKPADFAWPVESVLKVDAQGNVTENRNSLSFNTKELFLEETEDSSAFQNKEIRLIRDVKGYYYITADNFKNVYVFKDDDGTLSLEDKILVSESGINNPAFNQRQPFIELLNGEDKILINNDGISDEKESVNSLTKMEDENEK
ncbi:MAG: hypothetical protein C4539_05460 [Ignavibacteriales bacterium]|nr:MAG: hypothetical protein C4539_05460 [Ignavibacteriales bacterium]